MWMLWTSKDEAMRSYCYGWECRFLKACSRAPYLLDPARYGQTQKNKEKLTWIIHFHKLWAAKLCKSLSAHEASVSFSENPTIQSHRKASLKYLDMNLESEFSIFQMHPATLISRKKTSPQLNRFRNSAVPAAFLWSWNSIAQPCPGSPKWFAWPMCWCHAPRGSRHGRLFAFYSNPFPSWFLKYRYQQLKHDPWLSVLNLFDLCSHFWVHRSGGISVLCNKGRIQQKNTFSRWYPPTDNLSNTNSNKYSDILSDILLYLAFSLTCLLTFYMASDIYSGILLGVLSNNLSGIVRVRLLANYLRRSAG